MDMDKESFPKTAFKVGTKGLYGIWKIESNADALRRKPMPKVKNVTCQFRESCVVPC